MFRLFGFWLLFSVLLFPKGYALIVTIGQYPRLSVLEGAHQDNVVYREILRKWGVSNIVSLEDSEATGKNILYHLEDIANKIEPEDSFYMFFSGHGSSLYDELYSMKFQQAGLTTVLKDSGAILPYDFDPEQIAKTVIIGKRDLRPILRTIDEKVKFALIVFDACYSESSIRSGIDGEKENRTPNILTESDGYPYQNIIYIASSITKARSGVFSQLLHQCLDVKFSVEGLKACLNANMDKGFQIPVVLGYDK